MVSFTAGGERAVVTIGQFHIYLPRGASPSGVAAVLLAITPRLPSVGFNPGQLAADFISAVSPAVRPELVPNSATLHSFYSKSDLRYVVSYANPGYLVDVFAVDGGKPIFSGSLKGFIEWGENLTGLESALKKVVKFTYDGGSKPGADRMVRLEKVSRVDGVIHLEGYDLSKDDITKAYRRYSSDKIKGQIAVIS